MAIRRTPGKGNAEDFQEPQPRQEPNAVMGPDIQDDPMGGEGRGSEGPRDRPIPGNEPGGGIMGPGGPGRGPGGFGGATPTRPRVPTPGAGSASFANPGTDGGQGGVIPFSPIGSTDPLSMVTPGQGGHGGLFGAMGGLKGGGLGVPQNPFGGTPNDSIGNLIQLLMQGQGR